MNPEQFRDNDIVFGTKWFEKYQSRLLWLLNTPIIKYWFRWVMRIRKFDCDISKDISKITPNSYSTQSGNLITTDFRTHDKYSKRLYFAFKPFWYLLHAIDWAMFDRYEELAKLSFGFSTLTQYPGSIGTNNPVDGMVGSYGQGQGTWASHVNGAGSESSLTATEVCGIYQYSTTAWDGIRRAIFCFDTSALTSGATISATVMSLRGIAKDDTGSFTPNIDIYTSAPASTSAIANGDFDSLGTTSQTGSPITYANWSISAYNDFTFNIYTNISKTGITQLGTRNAQYDAANSAPTLSGVNNAYAELKAYQSEQTGTTNDPKLVITYTPPPILPKTGYRVRAYATNSAGTSYGDTVQVTTADDATGAGLLTLLM